jgi:hypothetical protein|tara:strand:- start:1402 stop:1662 length:261 start_codon:yes stop_codon:yes gene_type:complete
MRVPPYKRSDLHAGLLIKDLDSGDLGLLVSRFDLMKNWDFDEPIWVWDMFWSGPTTDNENRNVPFIEQAIVGLLNGGVWSIVESDA